MLPSPPHDVTGDEEREVAEAEARLATAVGRLEAKGVRAHGSRRDAQASHWSAADLVERARTIAPHVERVVV